jgi:endoglucanase
LNSRPLPLSHSCRRLRAPLLALHLVPLLVACQRPRAAAPDASGRADPEHNLLGSYDFEDGILLPWGASFAPAAAGEARVQKGAMCLSVDKKGENRWDAQLRHRQLLIQQSHRYQLGFEVWSSRATQLAVKVGMSGAPYTEHFTRLIHVTPTRTPFFGTFVMQHPDDPTAELAFHVGGQLVAGDEPVEICFDAVVLSEPTHQASPREAAPAPPRVRVNQLGYLPELPKWAVLVSDSPTPETWQLQDSSGKVLLQGESRVLGLDAASGDRVHQIDFSSFRAQGKELTLVVAAGSKRERRSDRFAVSQSLYAPLARDALRIFYHLRSGVAIEMPYVERPEWGHPPGHHPDLARCARDTGCDYSLDVSGGWYDAGDQGKYVVNGGLTTWLLLNAYERALRLGIDSKLLADGASNIPESGNGVPDVLDEARWELEFLISMRVPEGQPLAGLVHHKMHDEDWTALGTAPNEDQQPRVLRPPSTAATLNLAAVAAQASRLWLTFDPSFAQHCREVAEDAWRAARRHPLRLAPGSDHRGGGAYEDDEVGDEWYWAAAELFLTTGHDEYREHLRTSAFDGAIAPDLVIAGVATSSGLSWRRVAPLGQISLALSGASARGRLARDELRRYRSQLRATADTLLATLGQEGYRLPMHGHYPWGSNADVLGNMVLLGSAADGEGGERFVQGIVAGMDYLLGRNAMGQSYVTGYGARPLLHPHHRFWAHQANPRYPDPPPGAVSGGPNADLDDPYVCTAGLKGCPPQKCFIDHVEAYSVNEIAINWDAALAWSAIWLDAGGRRR